MLKVRSRLLNSYLILTLLFSAAYVPAHRLSHITDSDHHPVSSTSDTTGNTTSSSAPTSNHTLSSALHDIAHEHDEQTEHYEESHSTGLGHFSESFCSLCLLCGGVEGLNYYVNVASLFNQSLDSTSNLTISISALRLLSHQPRAPPFLSYLA